MTRHGWSNLSRVGLGGRRQVEERGASLALVHSSGLLPLNHTASDDAVKTPKVEKGNGAEKAHGYDLEGPE